MSRFARISMVLVPSLALSLVAVFRPQDPSAGAINPAAAQPLAMEKPALSPILRDNTLGVERVYSLQMTQATASRPSARDGKEPSANDANAMLFHVDVKGALSLVPTDKTEGAVMVRVSLKDASFRIRQGEQSVLSDDARKEVERSLEQGAFVEMSSEGHVASYRFPKGSAKLARTVLRSVVASTQPSLPKASEATWDTVEGDTGGEYRAFYRRETGPSITRKKGEYLRVTSPKGLLPAAEVGTMEVSGKSTFTLDDAGWVEQMNGTETLLAEAKGLDQLASTRVEVKLSKTGVFERPDLVSAFARAQGTWIRTIAAENDLARDAARETDRRLAKGARPRDVLASLEKLSDKDTVGRADARDQLAAIVRLDGRAATELAREVRGGLPAEAAGTVIGALASAGTESAQAALSEIVSDERVPAGVRADATMAIATAEEPSTRSVNTLREASRSDDREVRSAGALGMGAAAKTLNKSGDAPVDLVEELLARLSSASTPEERATLFHALGNSADARILPAVKSALASEGPTVRAAAVSALRLVEDEASDALLSASLLSDPERMVRNAALFAISFRKPQSFIPTLDAHLKSEPMKSVRLASVALLGKWRSVTGAASVLAYVMSNDSDAEVRAAAEELLNGE